MTVKSKVIFALPAQLQKELRTQVINDDYGMRGKSIWITEAILSLLKMNNYPELVNLSDEMNNFDKTETIVIDHKLKVALDDSILNIRRLYPTLEGVKSRIVRTAILQRLLHIS